MKKRISFLLFFQERERPLLPFLNLSFPLCNPYILFQESPRWNFCCKDLVFPIAPMTYTLSFPYENWKGPDKLFLFLGTDFFSCPFWDEVASVSASPITVPHLLPPSPTITKESPWWQILFCERVFPIYNLRQEPTFKTRPGPPF